MGEEGNEKEVRKEIEEGQKTIRQRNGRGDGETADPEKSWIRNKRGSTGSGL